MKICLSTFSRSAFQQTKQSTLWSEARFFFRIKKSVKKKQYSTILVGNPLLVTCLLIVLQTPLSSPVPAASAGARMDVNSFFFCLYYVCPYCAHMAPTIPPSLSLSKSASFFIQKWPLGTIKKRNVWLVRLFRKTGDHHSHPKGILPLPCHRGGGGGNSCLCGHSANVLVVAF